MTDGAGETGVVTVYDGIFKGMYNRHLKGLYKDARKLIAEGFWDAAKRTLEKALKISKELDIRDMRTLTLILQEMNRYDEFHLKGIDTEAESVDWKVVAGRALKRLDESLFEFPQGVFFLNIGKPGDCNYIKLVGRKILSDLWMKNKIAELFCSLVTADMFLGVLDTHRLSDSNVTVFYYPLKKSEKMRIMKDIISSEWKAAELSFPFPLLRQATHCEWGSPPEGWDVDDTFAELLGCGEENIRAYSTTFLRKIGIQRPLLYDPACSTGEFLASLQKEFPDSYTFGQDLSQSMTKLARSRVNEVHCANAVSPKIDPGKADMVYIRFLNSEVVKSSEAEYLLMAILPTVKIGGYVIAFGHTPVLLSSSNFMCLEGFQFLQSVGVAVDKTGIFQYYVVKRIA